MKLINQYSHINTNKNTGRSNKSRDNSRSRSKSPVYKNKNKFYFKQKSVFLTYPHSNKDTPIDKVSLGKFLFDSIKCCVVVVCQETHQDGSPHLHAWCEWEQDFYTSNYRIFDFRGHHPNIGQMFDKKKNTRGNALTYMIKEDKELSFSFLDFLNVLFIILIILSIFIKINVFSIGIDIDKWKYCSVNKNKYICEDLIAGNANLTDIVDKNPNILMNYNKLKTNLESYRLDKAQHSNPFKTKDNMWICGVPGSGKTYYATHLYPTFYLKPQNKWWDGYKGESVVILDDFDQPCLSHYLKIWADNYNCTGEIKNGSINLDFNVFIVTTNYMPIFFWPKDIELRYAIYRRFNFYSVVGQFPNFKRVSMKNPIETDIPETKKFK